MNGDNILIMGANLYPIAIPMMRPNWLLSLASMFSTTINAFPAHISAGSMAVYALLTLVLMEENAAFSFTSIKLTQ